MWLHSIPNSVAVNHQGKLPVFVCVDGRDYVIFSFSLQAKEGKVLEVEQIATSFFRREALWLSGRDCLACWHPEFTPQHLQLKASGSLGRV